MERTVMPGVGHVDQQEGNTTLLAGLSGCGTHRARQKIQLALLAQVWSRFSLTV